MKKHQVMKNSEVSYSKSMVMLQICLKLNPAHQLDLVESESPSLCNDTCINCCDICAGILQENEVLINNIHSNIQSWLFK